MMKHMGMPAKLKGLGLDNDSSSISANFENLKMNLPNGGQVPVKELPA